MTLSCEVSKAGIPAEWRRGGELLENGDKFQMKQRERTLELTIRDVEPEDSGVYTCACRDQRTKATVKVVGRFRRGPPPSPSRSGSSAVCLQSRPGHVQREPEEPGRRGGRQRQPALPAVQEGGPRPVGEGRPHAVPRDVPGKVPDEGGREDGRADRPRRPAGGRREVQLRRRRREDHGRGQGEG